MAEFCRQCAIEYDMYPEELAGLVKTGYVVSVICEGCGPTYVDEYGNCTEHPHPEGGGAEGER